MDSLGLSAFDRPVYELPANHKKRLQGKLNKLYDEKCAEGCFAELERIMKVYYAHKSPEMIAWEKNFNPSERFSEKDVVLITYGDLVRSPGQLPLRTLEELCESYLKGVFNTLHILPFFPFSSDWWFAVMDFEDFHTGER